jgi:hypothetical protein
VVLTQYQQNKGDDCGLQETAEGAAAYPHRRDSNQKVAGLNPRADKVKIWHSAPEQGS